MAFNRNTENNNLLPNEWAFEITEETAEKQEFEPLTPGIYRFAIENVELRTVEDTNSKNYGKQYLSVCFVVEESNRRIFKNFYNAKGLDLHDLCVAIGLKKISGEALLTQGVGSIGQFELTVNGKYNNVKRFLR